MTTYSVPLPVPLMSFVSPPGIVARRQRAAQLLTAVLDESIAPQLAINRWPVQEVEPDASLACAYQALWHFEADERQQRTEVFYLDAQLELLRQMARYLQAGQELPPYILRMYTQSSQVRFYVGRSWEKECQAMGQACWARAKTIWGQAWRISPWGRR